MTPDDLKALSKAIAEDNKQHLLEQQSVVECLDELGGDGERDHVAADNILLEYLRLRGEAEVAEAFERARKRVPFYYS